MGFINKKTGKKFFLFKGEAFQQSLANHEHPNQFLLPLEKKKPDCKKALALFQKMANDWFTQMKRFKAHRESGFTFYFCADVYSICMVSAVAGHYEQPIYGGNPKRFSTMSGMLQQFADDYPAYNLLDKNIDQVFKYLGATQGDLRKVATKFGVKPEDVKSILSNLDLQQLEGRLTPSKIGRLKKQCVQPWDYAIHVLETMPGQDRVVLC
jgi:hypothetical protein